MKKSFFLFCTVALLLAGSAWAQELITTGVVQSSDPQSGTLVVHSDQTHGPVSFAGVGTADISTVDGKPALLRDLTVGTKVTVKYGQKGTQLFVAKIIFGEAAPASVQPPPASK